jgi:methyl-accepting chemotaxis protein
MVIGIISIEKSSYTIKNEAKDKLLNIASSRGSNYSIETSKVENTVNEMSKIVIETIDVS